MIANFGLGALILTFGVAIYGVAAAIYGARKNSLAWVESARLAMLTSFPLMGLVALSLIVLLTNNQFEMRFVYEVSSRSMPFYLKVTALWGGQSGSLILWALLMSAFAGAVALRKWDRDRDLLPWVVVVCLVTIGFFVGLTLFTSNPFERIWQLPSGDVGAAVFAPSGASLVTPTDGNGLNPLLRHPGMVFHPPALYLGFVAFVIPFAFAFASLITKRKDDRWIRITRRWTLVGWLFLSMGLLLGSRWAYDVLGWGGYWGWDPSEVATLWPWLTATALLHSGAIQEKRGMFKNWNMLLVIATYIMAMLATFEIRSGLLTSVHAFSSSNIGMPFLLFIVVALVGSTALWLSRWNILSSETRLGSFFARETLFLLNNLILMGLLVVCLWGVHYPILSELFTGTKVTVGPAFYERATGPLLIVLLFLMGVCPLAAWGVSSLRKLGRLMLIPFVGAFIITGLVMLVGKITFFAALLAIWLAAFAGLSVLMEYGRGVITHWRRTGLSLPLAFWKLAGYNRRRYGGYIIHLGVVLMSLGIIGIEMFQAETTSTLGVGDSMSLRGYTLTYNGINDRTVDESTVIYEASLSVYRDNVNLGLITPRREIYFNMNEVTGQSTIPSVRTTLEDDLYVTMTDFNETNATFKVYHNPMINWLWIGGLIFILGTVVAVLPGSEQENGKEKS
jgi:cytochrome c-type biogenesis protein CcmF